MAMVLTDEQQMLKASVRGFLSGRWRMQNVRTLRDLPATSSVSRELWQGMTQMGWAGILAPEEYGGAGFGHIGAGIVFEEMGRQLCVAPMLSTAILAVTALLLCQNDTRKAELLPRIAAGDVQVALVVHTGARPDTDAVASILVTESNGGLRLTGRSAGVLDGVTANWFLVAARAGVHALPEETRLFLVDARAPGVEVESMLHLDGHWVSTVHFEQVPVSEELYAVAGVDRLITEALDAGRACLAAELLGIAEEAFTRTLDYLKIRRQFGVAIGSFQGLQHRMAALYCEIELVRSAVQQALTALDEADAERAKWVSLAKSKSAQIARRATQEAIQLHGGIGMTDECDIGLFLKRSRSAEVQLGDADYHAARFADALGF